MECIGTCGKLPTELVIDDLRRERSGYLNVCSIRVEGYAHRFEFMDRGSSVAILPIDYQRKEMYLIRIPRPPRVFARDGRGVEMLAHALAEGFHPGRLTVPGDEMNLWEVPAGMIDADDSSARAAAMREILEELGMDVPEDQFSELCATTLSIGGSTELAYLFVARVTERPERVAPKGDGTEHLEVWRVSFNEARHLINTNALVTATARILILSVLARELETEKIFREIRGS